MSMRIMSGKLFVDLSEILFRKKGVGGFFLFVEF